MQDRPANVAVSSARLVPSMSYRGLIGLSCPELHGRRELKFIATELITSVRKSVTIDWTLRARAENKVIVKRISNRYGYTVTFGEGALGDSESTFELLEGHSCNDLRSASVYL